MLKKTLLTVAAATAILGGATALQPTPAEAGVSVYLGSNHGWRNSRHYRPHYRRHGCYVTRERVWVHSRGHHRRGHWEWRRVRVCPQWHGRRSY